MTTKARLTAVGGGTSGATMGIALVFWPNGIALPAKGAKSGGVCLYAVSTTDDVYATSIKQVSVQ